MAELPLRAGVRHSESVALRVAVRTAAWLRDHHGEPGAVQVLDELVDLEIDRHVRLIRAGMGCRPGPELRRSFWRPAA